MRWLHTPCCATAVDRSVAVQGRPPTQSGTYQQSRHATHCSFLSCSAQEIADHVHGDGEGHREHDGLAEVRSAAFIRSPCHCMINVILFQFVTYHMTTSWRVDSGIALGLEPKGTGCPQVRMG
jgi:hypothetical protein